MDEERQEWTTPEVIVYGDVAAITQTKPKNFGNGDDFVVILS